MIISFVKISPYCAHISSPTSQLGCICVLHICLQQPFGKYIVISEMIYFKRIYVDYLTAETLTRQNYNLVDTRKAILVATRIALFSDDWIKGNSRCDENYCLLCSSEKSSSRILSRVTENWAILVVKGEKQLQVSRGEFSNSR